jgi:predicted amidohydrolase YtcJ
LWGLCWQTLLDRGIPCAGGSDAPIEDCNPLLGIYDAIHRLPHSFKAATSPPPADSDVFLPHERLTFSQALWLYTIGAAYACRAEARLGRIQEGYLADFVVLDQDVARDPSQLLTPGLQEVWVNGVCRVAGDEGGAPGREGAAVVGGPYVPGKNGPLRQVLLQGKRAVRCCGR